MTAARVVRTCVVTGYGINADNELRLAFELAGSEAKRVHIRDLIEHPSSLRQFHIVAFPGGFSFGDHLGSGLVFAGLFKRHLRTELESFLEAGKLIIGICNGFQVLVKMGVLPNTAGDWTPQVTLIHNAEGLFEDSWVRVGFDGGPCVWTTGIEEMDVPIRNGEGRFVADSPAVLDDLEGRGLIAVRYKGRNPNGSQADVAGITDPSGRILGLMPHPEAFLYPENHPTWTRHRSSDGEAFGEGLRIFRNGVDYAREHLCG